jgi:hypothetical protein
MVLKQTLSWLENNDKLKFVQHDSTIDSLSAIESFPHFCFPLTSLRPSSCGGHLLSRERQELVLCCPASWTDQGTIGATIGGVQ